MHRYHNPDNIVRHEPWYDPERDFVKVCHGKCCADDGASEVMETLHQHFRGSNVQIVACPEVGGCANGISVVINEKKIAGQNIDEVGDNVKKMLKEQAKAGRSKVDRVMVCRGPVCARRGSESLLKVLDNHYQDTEVKVQTCGCTGNCKRSRNVVVNGRLISLQTEKGVVAEVKKAMDQQKSIKQEVTDVQEDVDSILGL